MEDGFTVVAGIQQWRAALDEMFSVSNADPGSKAVGPGGRGGDGTVGFSGLLVLSSEFVAGADALLTK